MVKNRETRLEHSDGTMTCATNNSLLWPFLSVIVCRTHKETIMITPPKQCNVPHFRVAAEGGQDERRCKGRPGDGHIHACMAGRQNAT